MATVGSWEDDEDEDDADTMELQASPPRELEHDPRDRLRCLIQETIAICDRHSTERYTPE